MEGCVCLSHSNNGGSKSLVLSLGLKDHSPVSKRRHVLHPFVFLKLGAVYETSCPTRLRVLPARVCRLSYPVAFLILMLTWPVFRVWD